jgi:hypothetical protein
MLNEHLWPAGQYCTHLIQRNVQIHTDQHILALQIHPLSQTFHIELGFRLRSGMEESSTCPGSARVSTSNKVRTSYLSKKSARRSGKQHGLLLELDIYKYIITVKLKLLLLLLLPQSDECCLGVACVAHD